MRFGLGLSLCGFWLVAACSQPPQSQTDAAVEDATAPDPVSNPPAAPPAPPISVQIGSFVGIWNVEVKNTGAVPIQLNQVVANNLSGDPDCDIKVFENLAPDASKLIDFPSCGVVRSVEVRTSVGNQNLVLDDSDFLTAAVIQFTDNAVDANAFFNDSGE